MGSSLQDISGVGESIASNLQSEFGADLCDVRVDAITDVPYVSRAKAIHIKCCLCESIESEEAIIDRTELRLASRADTPEKVVTSIVDQFDQRATGRKTDMKKLIQHSLAVKSLRIEPYRQAINEHKDCLRDATASGRHAATVASNTSTSERTPDGLLLRGKRQLKEDIPPFIRLFLDSEGPFSTKLDAIIAVRLVFDPVLSKPLPGYILADTIRCSSGYATEFEVVEVLGEKVVLRKEHAARRQVRKTEDWQREVVLNRDEHTCVRCNKTDNLIIHHIVPVSQGGTDEIDNLATLCEDCHADAHQDSIDTPETVYDTDEFTEWIDQ